MGKYVVRCPHCDHVNTASSFIFAKKVFSCVQCGEEIRLKEHKFMSRVCPYCGEVFLFDQSKADKQKCPVCGKRVEYEQSSKFLTLSCPQCFCSVEVTEDQKSCVCPVCDYEMDVQAELAKDHLVRDKGISVLQYEGDNSTFVWKHPIENFNRGSVLNVHESQEAIFFLNGQALDSFDSGQHILDIDTLPEMKKAGRFPISDAEPIHSEVYFINKTVRMAIKWGTADRVHFIEPFSKLPMDIGASGELNLQVCNARKLVMKLVGTSEGLTKKDILEERTDVETGRALSGMLRAPLLSGIKSYLASVIRDKQINIFEIDSHLDELGEGLRDCISPKFEEYGLAIPQFYVYNVALPEDNNDFREMRRLFSAEYFETRKLEYQQELDKKKRDALREQESENAEIDLIRVKGQGAVEIARAQAEAAAAIARAQAEGEVIRQKGLAEAEVMRARGVTDKDKLDAQVQMKMAESVGEIASSRTGVVGGNGGADLVGIVAGAKTANILADSIEDVLAPALGVRENASSGWKCSCGAVNQGKFCCECGKQRDDKWTCACGTVNSGKFCSECGAKRN